MSNELVEIGQDRFNELSVQGHIAQRDRLVEIMKEVMKKDVHYGTIPGTNKPSLYKPGAERILMTFGLSAGKEEEWPIQDLSSDTERRFRLMVPIYHRLSGAYLGFGVGECSSAEDKYAWRGVVCDQEFDEADPDDRREKWKYSKSGKPYKVKQVRTNPADIANTVLKMAKKRALIDGALTTTGASEVFTQDVEDMPAEYLGSRESASAQHRQNAPSVPRTPKYGPEPDVPITEVGDDHLLTYAEGLQKALDIQQDQEILDTDDVKVAENKQKFNAAQAKKRKFQKSNQATYDAMVEELRAREARAANTEPATAEAEG